MFYGPPPLQIELDAPLPISLLRALFSSVGESTEGRPKVTLRLVRLQCWWAVASLACFLREARLFSDRGTLTSCFILSDSKDIGGGGEVLMFFESQKSLTGWGGGFSPKAPPVNAPLLMSPCTGSRCSCTQVTFSPIRGATAPPGPTSSINGRLDGVGAMGWLGECSYTDTTAFHFLIQRFSTCRKIEKRFVFVCPRPVWHKNSTFPFSYPQSISHIRE